MLLYRPSGEHRTAKFGCFNIETQQSREVDLPKNFLQPNQILVLPQEDTAIIYNVGQIGNCVKCGLSKLLSECRVPRTYWPRLDPRIRSDCLRLQTIAPPREPQVLYSLSSPYLTFFPSAEIKTTLIQAEVFPLGTFSASLLIMEICFYIAFAMES